ncbi:hypothetical protein ElyMa_000351100 [Elysia marginata]|uniref:MAM domain-containing protein n=1 Tax=Elysia marginata TaxID=1093978 RepID=A0AAV4FDF5_9GAST|nr:hypothetical protein ElyMa_000351100 [Elysia marginata]
MAFRDQSGVSGEVWTTYSSHEGLLYGIIFAANLTADYSITAQKAGFLSPFAPQFKAGHVFMAADPEGSATPFDKDTTFTIKASNCETDGEPFCLFYFSPQLSFGNYSVVLLGDLDKWVPMSEQRVVQIWRTASGMAASVLGKHGETINFSFLLDGKMITPVLSADHLGCATFPVTVNQGFFEMEEDFFDSNTTSTPAAPSTSLRPSVPTDYDCRFKPPPFTTPAPPTYIPIQSTTHNDAGRVGLSLKLAVFGFLAMLFVYVRPRL